MIRLESWAFGIHYNDEYTAPEAGNPVFYGKVYGHPKHADGALIRTSTVVGFSTEGKIITRSGSVYELGVVNPEYEKRFPDAQARMMKALREMQFKQRG
jgi:hypothetical protein